MNHLQRLTRRRDFCVTLNRTEAIDPAKIIRTIRYSHPVYTPARRRRPGASTRRSAGCRAHALLRRLLGLGLSRGRRRQRAARVRAVRGDAVSVAVADRHAPASAGGDACARRACTRARSATAARRAARRAAATGCSWPTSTSTSCRSCSTAACCGRRGARRSRGSAAPTTSATRTTPLADAVARSCCERTGDRARRADPPAHAPALPRPLLQPGQLLLLLRRRRRARARGRRRGDEHAVGRAPRLRAGRRRPGATTAARRVLRGRFAKALHVSPLMGMDHTYDWRLTEPARAPVGAHRVSARDDGERVFDATLSLRRRELTAARAAPRARCAIPLLTLRLTARIYAHALRLRLRGARYHPHPERRAERRRRRGSERDASTRRARDGARDAPCVPPTVSDAPARCRPQARPPRAAAARRLDRRRALARRLVLRLLSRTRGGELVVVEGSRAPRASASARRGRPLSAVLHVRSPRFYRAAAARQRSASASPTSTALWDCDDLVALTRIARAQRRRARPAAPRALARARPAAARRRAGWRATRPARARERIAAHYDLGNELFALFLDETMMYSCAVFESPERPRSNEASLAKLERVCRKLDLGPERPRARDRHRLGRLRDLRRRALRLPRDDDDDLRRAARLRDASASARPACRTASRCSRRTTATSRRAGLRQARLDRDDRGRRLAVLPDVLPPLLGAASPTTARCCCRRS